MPSLQHRARVSLCSTGTLPAPLHNERVAGGALAGAAAILRLPTPAPATPPAESWQDLGVLDVGLHRLAGSAATAGHDDDSEPNGDLDVFRFRVAEDTRVSFELSWEGAQDFDAVLYRDEGAETQLGFASEQAISLQMASTAQPERAELELSADESYLLMVANWWGEPEAPWELLLNLYPGSFP